MLAHDRLTRARQQACRACGRRSGNDARKSKLDKPRNDPIEQLVETTEIIEAAGHFQ